jgi:hypothetical protein
MRVLSRPVYVVVAKPACRCLRAQWVLRWDEEIVWIYIYAEVMLSDESNADLQSLPRLVIARSCYQ